GSSSGAIATGRFAPEGIVADANYVFWTEVGSGQVLRYTRSGGVATPTAMNEPQPHGITMWQAELFWTDYGSGNIDTCVPSSSCSMMSIVPGQHMPFSITADKDRVYWTNYSESENILSAAHGGGSLSGLGGTQANPARIVTDGVEV